MSLKQKRRVVEKTADYSISRLRDAAGTIFTNMGADGAVIFTLPTPTFHYFGDFYDFTVVADQNVTVAGAAAGDILTLHDVAANSVAVSTSSQKIGATLRAECVRTAASTYKWHVYGTAVGHTYSVAT